MSTANKDLEPAQIAVLMTCYNRCDITLACLDVLYLQQVNFQVYLVDDGSTDATQTAVSTKYPCIKILQGDGSLFWGGGMRMAFAEAIKTSHSYYLWLNDDTLLEPDALSRLVATHQALAKKGNPDSIVVGSVKDPITLQYTYGGRIRPTRWCSFKFRPVEPNHYPKECDTMQGNVVLIPHSVAEKIGNIDFAFTHNFGDLDYGLRAKKAGCSIWVAPNFVATCPKNSARGSYVDMTLPVQQRLQQAFCIKGFPFKSWTTYLRRHSGAFWFIYILLPYVRAVIGYKDLAASPSFTAETREVD
jgi:GT2 family glycosyltransferase